MPLRYERARAAARPEIRALALSLREGVSDPAGADITVLPREQVPITVTRDDAQAIIGFALIGMPESADGLTGPRAALVGTTVVLLKNRVTYLYYVGRLPAQGAPWPGSAPPSRPGRSRCSPRTGSGRGGVGGCPQPPRLVRDLQSACAAAGFGASAPCGRTPRGASRSSCRPAPGPTETPRHEIAPARRPRPRRAHPDPAGRVARPGRRPQGGPRARVHDVSPARRRPGRAGLHAPLDHGEGRHALAAPGQDRRALLLSEGRDAGLHEGGLRLPRPHRRAEQAGVVVLGVSNDDLESHRHFKEKQKLPFPLLADVDAKVSKLYGVYGKQSVFGIPYTGIQRTTFVIGRDGRIARVWPKVSVNGHVEEVLEFVRAGRPAPPAGGTRAAPRCRPTTRRRCEERRRVAQAAHARAVPRAARRRHRAGLLGQVLEGAPRRHSTAAPRAATTCSTRRPSSTRAPAGPASGPRSPTRVSRS